MIDSKELELLIRAKLKGRGDIESIGKSIRDLSAAIEQQAAAAAKGENAYDGLKAALDGLKAAQDQLAARANSLRTFEKQGRDLVELAGKVDLAKAKYEEYTQKLKALEADGKKATDAQIAQQQKLQASIDRQASKLDTQRKNYDLLGAALKEIGVDVTNLAAEQSRLVDAQLAGAQAIERGRKELDGYAVTVAKARAETKALRDQQAEARKEADLFAAAERRAAEAAQARAKAAEEYNQRQANRSADSAAFARQAAEERAALERQRELAQLRADIEARSAQTQRDTGLQKTADDAERAAKGYSTLARASRDLTPRVISLREAIDQIRDPSAKSVQSISDLEKSVGDLAGQVGKIQGPVKDYAETLQKLEGVQKTLASQAGLVDRYNKETAALRAARSEFTAARSEVSLYAAEVRKGGQAAEGFVKPLAEAERRLKLASTALREQITATAGSRDALRQAGINTSQLSQEQGRLLAVAKNAANTVEQLTAAYEKNGEAAGRASKGKGLFNDEGRTTLSLAQRIRGQLLAIASAYVGIFGAITTVTDALKVYNEQQALQSRLSLAVGNDPGRIAAESQYIEKQSDRIGINFREASKGYSSFAVSAVKAGQDVNNVRFIFESFAEAGKVLNLSGFQLEGLFNAISQSFSKGKIQAEELRGQIGERLPGAFQFAQEALKEFYPDLDKALEQGQVSAENMVLIAESVRRAVADRLPDAIKTLSAEQERFNNTINRFKLAIAEGGFADAFKNLLLELNTLLNSTDGKNFANAISQSLARAVDAIRFLVKNFEEVQAVAEVFVIFMAARFGQAVIQSLIASATAMSTFGATAAATMATATGAAGMLTVALRALGLVFPILGALAIAWNLGEYLLKEFQIVRDGAAYLAESVLQMWAVLKNGTQLAFAEIPRLAENAFKAMLNAATFYSRKMLEVLRFGADALGMTEVVKALDSALDKLTFKYTTGLTDEGKAIAEQFKRDLAGIKKIGDSIRNPGGDEPRQAFSDARFQAGQTTTTFKAPKQKTGPSEGDIKKRANEVKAIEDALNALSAKIDRADKEVLDKQLKAVDKDYKELRDRIIKLGGADSKRFLGQLEAGTAALKLQITKNFNDKLLNEQNALLAKIEAAEVASGRRQTNDLTSRLEAIKKRYEDTYRQIEEQRAKLQSNERDTAPADEAKRRLDAAVLELQNAERIKFNAEEMERIQTRVNNVVKSRADFIKAIRDQEEAGAITREEAEARIRTNIEQTQPVIDQLVEAGLLFAESMGAALDPARVEAFRAALVRAKGSGEALKVEMNTIGQVVLKSVGAAIDTMVDSMADALAGTKSWGDVWRSVGRSVLQIIQSIIADLIKAQLRAIILKAIMSSFGGGGAPMEAATGAPVFHSGGVVGSTASRTRAVSPAWFANAPRYHSGGVVGLAADEYPAILQKNEEVLSASDPRNVMNGGLSGGGGGSNPPMRFVLVDDKSRINEATAGAEGEQVWIQHLRKNLPTVRQMVQR